MRTLQSANNYYELQQQISAITTASAKKLWKRMGPDFSSSWADIRPEMLNIVQLGRAAAASSSLGYTSAVLAETGQVAAPVGVVNPSAFLSSAPDGRPMGSLLDETVIKAKIGVQRGSSVSSALDLGGRWLTAMLLTVMADTGRAVVSVDIAQRPTLTGYVRMLNPPSCERCVILAGKYFKWNQGFLRHPRCDCRHVPASEDIGGDLRTDPYAYFKSLSPEAQEKTFGRIEARAIREGADIYRVVNLKGRGLATAKGALKFGTPSQMTIDDIFRTAGTRTNAIRMMEREGYITGAQVRGGNILGQVEGFGQFGKGGKGRAASNAVLEAQKTGVRDPLNRYTMTAAERRLYDAKVRLDIGRTGIWPQSIGANSADKYRKPRPINPDELRILETSYYTEVLKLPTAPDSVRTLAGLLGIT